MKIIIKIPKAQEQAVLEAFANYNDMFPNQKVNLEQNILAFVKNVYKGMETTKQVTVVANTGKNVVEKIPDEVNKLANKLSIESNEL